MADETSTTQHGLAGQGVQLGVRGWLVLTTLCAATFLTALDFSIITVALPEIGRDLEFSTAGDLQWVATACLLPTASLLPLFGRVSDLVGRRRLFAVGLVLLTGFSLLAGLATTPTMLVIARIGQGIAAAMIAPTAISLMTASFPEGPQRTRALGINGALLSLGFVVGTVGGGLITSGLGWRWTMLILVILGLPVLVGALTVVPKDAVRGGARLDVPGALLATGGLFSLVYAVSTGAEAGWQSPSTVGSLAAAVVLLAVFLLVEARHPAPLVPLGLLNRRTVKWSGLVGFITFGMCGGATVLLSLYMQDVLGYSALATGIGFLAEGAAALVAGAFVSKMINEFGVTSTMITGLAIQAVSTAAMVLLPVQDGLGLLLITSGGMGFGHVLAIVAFVNVMTSGLRTQEQGIVGGLSQLPQFLGAIGVAGLAAVVTLRTQALSATTTPTLATLGGLHAAWLVAAAVVLLGIAVAVTRLRRVTAAVPDEPPSTIRTTSTAGLPA